MVGAAHEVEVIGAEQLGLQLRAADLLGPLDSLLLELGCFEYFLHLSSFKSRWQTSALERRNTVGSSGGSVRNTHATMDTMPSGRRQSPAIARRSDPHSFQCNPNRYRIHRVRVRVRVREQDVHRAFFMHEAVRQM